jgi:signal transduction histidine kinase
MADMHSGTPKRMKPRFEILLLEDNVYDAELIWATLRRDGIDCLRFRVDAEEDFLKALTSGPFDLILSDYSLPSFDGMSALALAREHAPLCPFVFISGWMGEDLAIESLKAGASDYVLKNRLARLGPVVRRAVAEAGERKARREAELAREQAHARLTVLDRAKSDFLNIISHELRTPLNGLFGASELILSDLPDSTYARELQGLYGRSRERLLSLVDDALLLTQIGVDHAKFRPSEIALISLVERALERAATFAAHRGVHLAVLTLERFTVMGEEDLLLRALHALLETGIKFCQSGALLEISAEAGEGGALLTLDCSGRSLPESAVSRFFDVFSIGEALTPGGDLGLGPALACRILSLSGATVAVANRGESAVRIEIAFGAPPPALLAAPATVASTHC